jgi:hypothetical protein
MSAHDERLRSPAIPTSSSTTRWRLDILILTVVRRSFNQTLQRAPRVLRLKGVMHVSVDDDAVAVGVRLCVVRNGEDPKE